VLSTKWDSLVKHVGHRKVVKDLKTLQLGYQKRKKTLKYFFRATFYK